ncbi:hypothetical protein BY996DRAFT_6609120 [Phakopsora pachyrhizi]|nr:hypothetical protein BY996DRAFT_6609120 [Phakopsora pachyrhizi]
MVPLTPKSACKLQYEAHIGTLLEALSLLVTANVRISNCRLAEQAVPVVLHKRLTKKGKCKEKGNTTVTYPLVGLLALLDYDSLFKQPNLTEFITGATNSGLDIPQLLTSHSERIWTLSGDNLRPCRGEDRFTLECSREIPRFSLKGPLDDCKQFGLERMLKQEF